MNALFADKGKAREIADKIIEAKLWGKPMLLSVCDVIDDGRTAKKRLTALVEAGLFIVPFARDGLNYSDFQYKQIQFTGTLADLGVMDEPVDLDALVEAHKPDHYESENIRKRRGLRWRWLSLSQRAYVANHPSGFVFAVVPESDWSSTRRIDFHFGNGPNDDSLKEVGSSHNRLIVISTPVLRARLAGEAREKDIDGVESRNYAWALTNYLGISEDASKQWDRTPFNEAAYQKAAEDADEEAKRAQKRAEDARKILFAAKQKGGFPTLTERFRKDCAEVVDGWKKDEKSA